MASQQSIVDFIMAQIASAGTVRSRKMFGGLTVYCDDKVVALVCDEQLFVKPTHAGRNFIGEVTEAPAYPGAKPSFQVSANRWDDEEWLSELIRLTAAELPLPRKKKPKIRK